MYCVTQSERNKVLFCSVHKCEVVKSFLASKKVKVLNHPHYSPDLSPCDFFLFPRLKKCFLEISIRLEGLLAALFISVSNRYQAKTIYLLFATGYKKKKGYKNVFQ